MCVCVCVCVCVSVHLCVCMYVTSHISETSEEISIKFDKVTASVTRMHHILSIFTLTFIQDTDLNHESITWLILLETFHGKPIKFAVIYLFIY